VALPSGVDGTLLDISESGALLELAKPEPVGSHIAFELHSEGGPVTLQGRVVRAIPKYDGAWRVEWQEPVSFHVGIEFFDLAAQCATTLRQILRKAGSASTPP
jgi:hypothetical protein